MSSTKCEGLSYPNHFLKVGVVFFFFFFFFYLGVVSLRIIFLNTEQNKSHFLRDEMICMHCSLQIKQNIYSICIFCAPVVTQFIVKV